MNTLGHQSTNHDVYSVFIAFLIGAGTVLSAVALYISFDKKTLDFSSSPTPLPHDDSLVNDQRELSSPSTEVTVVPDSVNYYLYKRKVGQHYFSDTLVLLTKDYPKKILLVTANRMQTDNDQYTQSSAVSYYDGQTWQRQRMSATPTTQAEVTPNQLITSYQIGIEESRVTGEIISGQVMIEGQTIDFVTRRLENEMVIRSWPGYTKLLSSGEGVVTIDNQNLVVDVLYTQIYSLNDQEIQFYDTHLPLETVYVAFWDEAGNFYHVDQTLIDKPTDVYNSRQIGVWKNNAHQVSRIFQLQVEHTDSTPPNQYHINLSVPIQTTLDLAEISSISKSQLENEDWYLSLVEGEASSGGQIRHGFGYVEYLKEW